MNDNKHFVTRIGFLGPDGTFSNEAAREAWRRISFFHNSDCEFVPFDTPHLLKLAIFHQEIDWAVIPVHNSITGPVKPFLDEFTPMSFFEVTYSFDLPIHHCLFKLPDINTSELCFVFSHPQALAQTASTRRNGAFSHLEERTTKSTGQAAEMLSNGSIPAQSAVICSKASGIMHGLELIIENMEDSSDNTTTFLLLGI